MKNTDISARRAILAAADLGEYDMEISLAELRELAFTAGIETVGTLVQKRSTPDRATLLGAGRIAELAEECKNLDADVVIFDCELSPSRQRNIEKALGDVEVVDRTTLILSIFAERASSGEGRLQVELAQQRYRLPRLSGKGTEMSRLGAGSSLSNRGPGETKLETDRRHVRRRVEALERELDELEARRGHARSRRKKDGVVKVAIVGYTNAGKTTLLSALADSAVKGEDKLFATLDPTSRGITLPDGREILLTDTVGFIRRLPHHLVKAFKSTLEEATDADLILNVCDSSSEEVREQSEVTRDILGDLGAGEVPVLTVFNKCDRLDELPDTVGSAVFVSAATGYGLDALVSKISDMLDSGRVRLELLIPFDKGSLISEIEKTGEVFSRDFTPDGTVLSAAVDRKILHKVLPYAADNKSES